MRLSYFRNEVNAKLNQRIATLVRNISVLEGDIGALYKHTHIPIQLAVVLKWDYKRLAVGSEIFPTRGFRPQHAVGSINNQNDLTKETERLEEKLDTHDNRWTTRTPISTLRCRKGHPQKPKSVRSDRTCQREVDALVRCTVKVSLSHVTTPSLSVVNA